MPCYNCKVSDPGRTTSSTIWFYSFLKCECAKFEMLNKFYVHPNNVWSVFLFFFGLLVCLQGDVSVPNR